MLHDFLKEILSSQREIVEHNKLSKSLAQIKKETSATSVKDLITQLSFSQKLLHADKLGLIAEVKKASPSKGIIRADFDPVSIAKEYEKAGANCLSVLTEPKYFMGNIDYIRQIKDSGVKLPILRKDFIIDEYQIYESKLAKADAILLIEGVIDTSAIDAFIDIAHNIGLEVLLETHTPEELEHAIYSKADLVGINNRNLSTFDVNIERCFNMQAGTPLDYRYKLVAESGISNIQDIQRLRKAKFGAVLIGETFMRSPDISESVKSLMETK